MSYVYAAWWLRLKKPLFPGDEDRELTQIHMFKRSDWLNGKQVAICGRPIHPWARNCADFEQGIEHYEPPIPVEKLCGRCLKIAGKE